MKARIDLRFLRTVMRVRLALMDRAIFRGLAQTKDRVLRERCQDQLVDVLTRGWCSYDLSGEADPDAVRHDMPPSIPEQNR